MLIEARMRQKYYCAISTILEGTCFRFSRRTRRPPEDAVNAMMGFGNVCLYQRIATEIHKAGLDTRFSFLHASQKGRDSLNLDIAEVFKPLIVDRAILSLINRREIDIHSHFEEGEYGGIYLNREGKRIFLQELQDRLFTSVTVKGKNLNWLSIIRNEVYKIKSSLLEDSEYQPYHHR